MSQTLKEKYDLKCKELSEKKYDQEFFSGRRQDDAFTDGFNAALELAQKDVDELKDENEKLDQQNKMLKSELNKAHERNSEKWLSEISEFTKMTEIKKES